MEAPTKIAKQVASALAQGQAGAAADAAEVAFDVSCPARMTHAHLASAPADKELCAPGCA